MSSIRPNVPPSGSCAGNSRCKMREIEKCHRSLGSGRPTTTCSLEKCPKLAPQLSRFQGSQRSSGRSRHANHPGSSPAVQEIITPHIPQKKSGPPFFNFPPYFFKVADLRFNTFLDTYGTLRHCCRSLRALEMLPMDSPSNSTLDGTFAPHFRKRSLAKIEKIQKIFSVAIEIQAGKKIAT